MTNKEVDCQQSTSGVKDVTRGLEQRRNIFKIKGMSKNIICNVIMDGKSCENMVSEDFVRKSSLR